MLPTIRPRSCLQRLRPGLLAGLALAATLAQAQFAKVPAPQPQPTSMVSEATNNKTYRVDAARHIYGAYPSLVLHGVLPPMLYAIAVTETEIDARGKVLSVRMLRPPAIAKEVGPWVVSLIRRASPFPQPARAGRLKFQEVWLVDESGQFQVHSLTEGQR
jgi:periplasmic protein TonB